MNNLAARFLFGLFIGLLIFVADVLAREIVENRQKKSSESKSLMKIEHARDVAIYSNISSIKALDMLLLDNKGWKVIASRKYQFDSTEWVDVYHADTKILIREIPKETLEMSREITKAKEGKNNERK